MNRVKVGTETSLSARHQYRRSCHGRRVDRAGPVWTGIPAQIGPAPAKVAQVAARQHGTISFDQLLACGLGRSTIGDWVRAGRLHRIHRGVFAVGTSNLTRDGRYMAAVLAGGRGATLAWTSAARHIRLDRTRAAGTIHLHLPRGNKRSPQGVLVHRPRELPPQDVITVSGIRTTAATRTLYDLTPSLTANELRVRFERAERDDALDRPRLIELIRTSSNHKRIANLRNLADYEPLPLHRIRSLLEGTVLSTCRTHGLPIPGVNVPLLDYEVDFLWPEARFIVEADGPQHEREQREKDNARDIDLARRGYLVRRYGEEAAQDGRAVAAEVLDILRERLP